MNNRIIDTDDSISPDNIHDTIHRKLAKIDSRVDDCYSGAVIDIATLVSDLGYYVDNGNISDEDYFNYKNELTQTLKEFSHRCVCFKGSIDGELFP